MRITLFMQLNECLGRIQAFYSPFLQFLQDNPGGPGFPGLRYRKASFIFALIASIVKTRVSS